MFCPFGITKVRLPLTVPLAVMAKSEAWIDATREMKSIRRMSPPPASALPAPSSRDHST
jgi:hypothetical protein